MNISLIFGNQRVILFTEREDCVNYIVFDLEWNQAADSKARHENDLMFEIIEIGAVKLNSKKEPVGSFHELIKPQVFHTMNQVTGELVHIKMEQLEGCRGFTEAAADFINWCGKDYIFCTWGSLDVMELQRNMDYHKMTPVSETPIRFFDIQKLFSIAFEDKKIRRTLQYAVDFLDIRKDVAFHRAYADAYYTAEVIRNIRNNNVFENYSYDTYRLPRNKSEEIKVRFSDYFKYISREFPDKACAMEDREVRSVRCFICGAKTKKKIAWFTNNGRNYYTIVTCACHGNIKGKIRLRRSAGDGIYVVKTMKQADPEIVEEILDKKNQVYKNRKEHRKKLSSSPFPPV